MICGDCGLHGYDFLWQCQEKWEWRRLLTLQLRLWFSWTGGTEGRNMGDAESMGENRSHTERQEDPGSVWMPSSPGGEQMDLEKMQGF